jgi:hypothetical protein
MDDALILSSSMAVQLQGEGPWVQRFHRCVQNSSQCLFGFQFPETLVSGPPSMSLLALEVIAGPHLLPALAPG